MYQPIRTQNITIITNRIISKCSLSRNFKPINLSKMSKLQINLKYFKSVLSKSSKLKRPHTAFLPIRSSPTFTQNQSLLTATTKKTTRLNPFESSANGRSPSSWLGFRSLRCTSLNQGRPSSSTDLQQCKFQVVNKRCLKKIIQQKLKPSNKIDFLQILNHHSNGNICESKNNRRENSYHGFQSRKFCSIRNKKKVQNQKLAVKEGSQQLSSSLRISILGVKFD